MLSHYLTAEGSDAESVQKWFLRGGREILAMDISANNGRRLYALLRPLPAQTLAERGNKGQ